MSAVLRVLIVIGSLFAAVNADAKDLSKSEEAQLQGLLEKKAIHFLGKPRADHKEFRLIKKGEQASDGSHCKVVKAARYGKGTFKRRVCNQTDGGGDQNEEHHVPEGQAEQ